MNEKNDCPICGFNQSTEMTPFTRLLIRESGGIIEEQCNPGGRYLRFGNGKEIQLSDMCNACDYEAITKLLVPKSEAPKPCPFCGGDVLIEVIGGYVGIEHKPEQNCFLEDMETFYRGHNSEEIIKLWNTRHGA